MCRQRAVTCCFSWLEPMAITDIAECVGLQQLTKAYVNT